MRARWLIGACSNRHAMVNKGIFVAIKYYIGREKYYTIEPWPVSWFQRLTNNLTVMFVLPQYTFASYII